MRNLDFAPLYRATVGFDRIADLMDRALTADVPQPTYPPYNIEKTAEDAYRISIAVAGFAPEDLSVGPHFPRERAEERAPSEPAKAPRRPEVVVPAGAIPPGGLHNRLGSLDVQEFQVSALERLEAALRQVEVRALGEVAAAEAPVAPEAPPALQAIVATPGPPAYTTPTRSAVWGEEPAAVAPAVPTPTAPLPGFPEGEEAAARPVVEGNRTAFETWLRRLGGK